MQDQLKLLLLYSKFSNACNSLFQVMNTNKNQNVESITMDLENLRKKYSNLLIQYKTAVADYINHLNGQTQQPYKNNQQLVTIQGQAFNGTGSAGQSSATTLQECVASCNSSKTCTGATFISNKCEIRTGDSPLVPSSKNSYAIIPKGKKLLLNMENINQQLLAVNKKILDKIEVSEPVYDETNSESKSKNQELIQNYKKLIEERKTIEKILNEYETLDNTENENQIKISQNYYSYILLLILVLATGFLLYKMFGSGNTNITTNSSIQYGGDLGINAYYMTFGLILLIIFFNFSIKYLSL